jgi:tRNA nucleotidyltransferase (CCA-adding enzyme)
MTTGEYLTNILNSQTLTSDGPEIKDLQARRADVEAHVGEHFAKSSPVIRYGGSKAKGTMIKESYDLDIVCYFQHDDTDDGDTLEDIYNKMRNALAIRYLVEPKSSALRLKDASTEKHGVDFHIDVVPGRFTDTEQADAFLYISSGEKNRLKTNLDVHVAHVRESGLTDAIRLMKQAP